MARLQKHWTCEVSTFNIKSLRSQANMSFLTASQQSSTTKRSWPGMIHYCTELGPRGKEEIGGEDEAPMSGAGSDMQELPIKHEIEHRAIVQYSNGPPNHDGLTWLSQASRYLSFKIRCETDDELEPQKLWTAHMQNSVDSLAKISRICSDTADTLARRKKFEDIKCVEDSITIHPRRVEICWNNSHFAEREGPRLWPRVQSEVSNAFKKEDTLTLASLARVVTEIASKYCLEEVEVYGMFLLSDCAPEERLGVEEIVEV